MRGSKRVILTVVLALVVIVPAAAQSAPGIPAKYLFRGVADLNGPTSVVYEGALYKGGAYFADAQASVASVAGTLCKAHLAVSLVHVFLPSGVSSARLYGVGQKTLGSTVLEGRFESGAWKNRLITAILPMHPCSGSSTVEFGGQLLVV